MRILILGGTRFVGRTLATHLLGAGHAVAVASRRPENAPDGAEVIGVERTEALRQLAGRTFDITMDFMCYEDNEVGAVFESLEPGRYVLVSSTWVPRLRIGCRADEAVSPGDWFSDDLLLPITRRYLEGKVRAEARVAEARTDGRSAMVIRLPIVWGCGDRTGRLEFYRRRVLDGGPIIAVDGAFNRAQIAWSEDIAAALAQWLDNKCALERPIWEALPDRGCSIREVIGAIADGLGRSVVLVDLPVARLAKELPGYLEAEPLWRETALNMTDGNLFEAVSRRPTPLVDWLRRLVSEPDVSESDANCLRVAERDYLHKLQHVY